jgi:hypothetical protein
VSDLAPTSQAVFRACVGLSFAVAETDHNGLVVLDVSPTVDPIFGGYKNDIRVEPRWVDPA